jgi:hypothetical protein
MFPVSSKSRRIGLAHYNAFVKILCLSVVDTKNILLQPQEIVFSFEMFPVIPSLSVQHLSAMTTMIYSLHERKWTR